LAMLSSLDMPDPLMHLYELKCSRKDAKTQRKNLKLKKF